MAHIVVWSGSMERAAIVPDDQVADLPAMPVNKASRGSEFGEFVEKRTSLRQWPCRVAGIELLDPRLLPPKRALEKK